MTSDEQLQLWLDGQSVHNPTTNECCPDFSCCVPELQNPYEQRLAYVKHEYERRMGLLVPPKCIKCGGDGNGELRWGFCFDCASAGEEKAARRTVWQHVVAAAGNIRSGGENWRYDLSWAWQRLTRSGDYKRGGCFEREYGIRL